MSGRRSRRRRPPAPAGRRRDEVTDRVLALVAEQTGYPPDLLDLDLDLEADLGIDTVKQAEVFATIRELRHPLRRDLKLRDYPTLTTWSPSCVSGRRSRRRRPPRPRPHARHEVTDRVLALVAEQTGYPPDLLDLDLDLEADLGSTP